MKHSFLATGAAFALALSSSLALADVGPIPACTADQKICTDASKPCGSNGKGSCGPQKCTDTNNMVQLVCTGGEGGAGGGAGAAGSGGSSAGAGGSSAGAGGSSAGAGGSSAGAGGSSAGSAGSATTPPAEEDDGGGCSVAAPRALSGFAGLLLGLGAAVLAFRRRR